jgi:hypothetical protein
MSALMPIEVIEHKIFVIRGQRVMIDRDLAELYGVKTFVLNQAVKRNIGRFPQDFMFQLTDDEWEVLISQIVISNEGRGGRRFNPYVFTEQGVAMLSSVLKSERAIAVNVQIIRTFVKLREFAITHKELAIRLNELEKIFISYAKDNNTNIEEIFKQLAYLTDITKPEKIGFKTR